jgi:hypothetical protein
MDAVVKHPTNSPQHELVQGYCREAEGLIMIARSRSDAIRIKDEWCTKFKQKCESELLINATSAYLDEIIARQWGEHAANQPNDHN